MLRGGGARRPRRSRAQSYRAPDAVPRRSQAGHFNTCGRAYVHVSPEYLWKMFPFMSLRQATEALRELREGGLIAEREYGGLDPDYRNWYTLAETGNAVA